ncbi:MAG: hypothetical protein JWQ81_1713 [Amycolatopsis sp.]|jgi:hypothetical protein|uniref:DUF2283 domain-containing protein n=1 Tax=Amycolatopsis sp. TaxID=37632 RepID=UPI00262E8ECA|nr:DUF2283 domain-containing protein [Amycolatopsis sp.]MCU1680974.1 hypothetical protein [Amycolatopsis sp.]
MTYPAVRWDKTVNAATIALSSTAGERSSLTVKDKQGDVVAILDFSAGGELLEIELLVADEQLPRPLRDQG